MLRGVFFASSAAVGKRIMMSPLIHEETNSKTNFRISAWLKSIVGSVLDSGFFLILTLIIFLSSELSVSFFLRRLLAASTFVVKQV